LVLNRNDVKINRMEKLYEKYMLVIGVGGQLLYYLQAYKIFASKNSENVSLEAFLLGFISVASWLIYGIILKNRVLIVSNIFAVIGALSVITGILLFSK